MKILIVFFSATGNTAKMVEVIKEQLQQLGSEIDVKDITSFEDRKPNLDLTPYHAVIFGFPIHANRAPRVVREWLNTLDGKNKLCATFFTYGGFNVHPTHYSTRQILEKRGFGLVSSAEFLGKHTFNLSGWKAMVDRPDKSDFEVAKEYAEKTFRRFTGEDSGRPAEFEKTNKSEKELDELEEVRFLLVTQFPSRLGEDCSLCMDCETLCPTGTMNALNGEVRDKEKCIACLRCIDSCPEDALSINDCSLTWPLVLEKLQESEESLKIKCSKIYL
jgi:flavodoxin/NAD-dependent dihydropyrimidine dehydrogenase PreA subunit